MCELHLKAVLLLLRTALGEDVRDSELGVLQGIAPAQIVTIATAHCIPNLLGRLADDERVTSFLDPELVLFLKIMRERNASRNSLLRDQLLEAIQRLKFSGIPSVALKGGAELLDPVYSHPPDRFMSDLDLLVPVAHIDDAISSLEELGYTTHGKQYERRHHHAPPLWHERWPTGIELHTSISSPPGDRILPADTIFTNAQLANNYPAMVPTIADRLCHLLVHAQVHDRQFSANLILLRDVADFQKFTARPTILDKVRRRFEENTMLLFVDSFVCAAEEALGRHTTDESRHKEARKWTKRTLYQLARPHLHRRASLLGYWLHHLHFLRKDKALALKYFRNMMRPKTLYAVVSYHLRALRGSG